MGDRGTELFYQQQLRQQQQALAGKQRAAAFARAGVPMPESNYAPGAVQGGALPNSPSPDDLIGAMLGQEAGGVDAGADAGSGVPASNPANRKLPPEGSFGDTFKAARANGSSEFTWNGKLYTTELASQSNANGKTTTPSGPIKGKATSTGKLARGQAKPLDDETEAVDNPQEDALETQSAMPQVADSTNPNTFSDALHTQPASQQQQKQPDLIDMMLNDIMGGVGKAAGVTAAGGAGAAMLAKAIAEKRGMNAAPPQMGASDLGIQPKPAPTNDAYFQTEPKDPNASWFDQSINQMTQPATPTQQMAPGDVGQLTPEQTTALDQFANRKLGKAAVSPDARRIVAGLRDGRTSATEALDALKALGTAAVPTDVLKFVTDIAKVMR